MIDPSGTLVTDPLGGLDMGRHERRSRQGSSGPIEAVEPPARLARIVRWQVDG
jgi:hypothetical protein